MPVRALVDKVLADDTVARALLASRNAVIERELAVREARGEARTLAASVLRVLALRGLTVSDETRGRVTGCDDVATLERWLDRAVTAADAQDVFGA